MTVTADAAQLRQFAKQLTTHSGSVDQIVTKISSTLQSVKWQDGYKDRLQQDWDGHFRTTLTNLKENLNNVAKSINSRASTYEQLQRPQAG